MYTYIYVYNICSFVNCFVCIPTYGNAYVVEQVVDHLEAGAVILKRLNIIPRISRGNGIQSL